MSDEESDHTSVINSTMTEMVLILLFGFMLVSLHFGSQAKSLAAQAGKDKERIGTLEAQIANGPPTGAVGVKGPEPSVLIDNTAPPCLVKSSGTRHGIFLLVTEEMQGSTFRVRLNRSYDPNRSGLDLTPDILNTLKTASPYTVEELQNLAHRLLGHAKPGTKCSINLSVPDEDLLTNSDRKKLKGSYNIGEHKIPK
jgi:hypothetical protein